MEVTLSGSDMCTVSARPGSPPRNPFLRIHRAEEQVGMGEHRAETDRYAQAGVGGGGRFRGIPFGRDAKRLAGVGPCRRVHVELADDAPLLGEGAERSVLALRLSRGDEGA